MSQTPRSFDQFARERVVHMRAQRARRVERRTSPRQAYEQLRSEIGVHGWDGSGKLSEPRLVEELGLTRNSVRAALQHLASEGLVTRQTRNGTQVALPLVQIPLDEEHPHRVVGSAEQPRVVSHESHHLVLDELDALRDLGEPYADAARLLVIERDLAIDTERIGWQLTLIPLREGSEESELDAVSTPLVAELEAQRDATPLGTAFLRAFGVALGGRSSTVQARQCTPELAARLQVSPGAPLLFRELVLVDVEDVVRRVTYTHLLGDRVALATHFG